MKSLCWLPFACLLFCSLQCIPAHAAIVVSGFFSGTIEQFDEQSGAQSTFATIANDPGLSGIAYSSLNSQLYVSALNHGGIYTLNAQTGALTGFQPLGIGPGGLAIASNGDVYVSDFTSNNVRIFDSTLTTPLGTISTPDGTTTSGIGFANNGDLLIATPGAGVYRYDGNAVSLFANNPLASAQIAVNGDDNIFIGHGLGFSDNVFRYDSAGNLLGTLTVTDSMVEGTGNGSSTGTSPSGVLVDSEGNVFVAALGRSNPSDPGGERGGLFKFDAEGNLLETFASGSIAFSGIAQTPFAVPEPSSLTLAVVGMILMSRRRQRPMSP